MGKPEKHYAPSRRYAPWLWLLLGLFLFRIIAQPLALLGNAGFLPPFESWHSGALPYPMLLASQCLILIWLMHTALQFSSGTVRPRQRLGKLMLVLGGIYFGVMLIRLLLGLTILGDQRWFASRVPTFFHLVLASYLLLYGHFHNRYGVEESA